MEDTLTLVGYDEGGARRGPGGMRLVCNIQGGGKVAVWGSVKDTVNIDAVLAAGLPCDIRCRWEQPSGWARRYGHTQWIPRQARLEVVQQRNTSGPAAAGDVREPQPGLALRGSGARPPRSATPVQRWFIRALARDSGKQPAEWLEEARRAGATASEQTHQAYLHARSSVPYTALTAPMAGRLIAWMRRGQLRPTYAPDDPKPMGPATQAPRRAGRP